MHIEPEFYTAFYAIEDENGTIAEESTRDAAIKSAEDFLNGNGKSNHDAFIQYMNDDGEAVYQEEVLLCTAPIFDPDYKYDSAKENF